jgi:hypothetical protein
MKITLTKVVKVGVQQSQGKASRALGGLLGQGHEGHTSTSEGYIQLHGLGGFGVLGLKIQEEWFLGLGLKTQGRTQGGTWCHRVEVERLHEGPMTLQCFEDHLDHLPPVVQWFVSKCMGILGVCN